MFKLYYIIIFIIIIPCSLVCQDRTYYVDDSGLDTNPGTFALPFQTIQHAANVMSSNTTSATCFISPGLYFEQVDIFSNMNNRFMVFTALTNSAPPILNGNGVTNYSFYITNTARIMIKNLNIKNYADGGIHIRGASSSNYIIKNNLYTNVYGIMFVLNEADNNFVLSNNIFNNQASGIIISYGDNNQIISNKIYNNFQNGIQIMNGAMSNLILNNQIYSNEIYGIDIRTGVTSSPYNIIIQNNIYGTNQDRGINLWTPSYTKCFANKIHHVKNGLWVNGSTDGYFSNNEIYSNLEYGVYVYNSSDNTTICSNHIWGPQSYGIIAGNSDFLSIYYNLIHSSISNQIKIFLDGTSFSKVINNTVANTVIGDGIFYTNLVTGLAYNNLSINNNGYGINNASSGGVIIKYNDSFGNIEGNFSTNISLSNNHTQDPLIDPNTYSILSASSICVDNGTHYAGITTKYEGTAPDIGWNEFSFPSFSPDNTLEENITPVELDKIVMVPNPYDSIDSVKKVITFFHVPQDTIITIYDSFGQKKIKLKSPNQEHKISWAVKDSNGEPLNRGVYFIKMENSQAQSRLIKLIIQR